MTDKVKEQEKVNKGKETEESLDKSVNKLLKERIKLLKGVGYANANVVDGIFDMAKNLEDTFVSLAGKIPVVGKSIEKNLKAKIKETGGLQEKVGEFLTENVAETTKLGRAIKFLLGPGGLFLALITTIAGIIRSVRAAARDLGQDLNVSTKQARALLIPLKAQELKFKAIGLDATKLKTTLAAISDEFGSLENVTARNAANVSRLAQNTGVSGKEIVQFNKVMMDLTGASFDVATNIAQTAADLAKSANVATGKVLSDIASNAEKFAKFSMDGANGLAEAAVEAAKIGGSLETILTAADKLLDFESSLTAQFKAQVLTGKQLNLEKARQLSLEGDIAGFTQEIQSVIGGLGDLQALNVVQRQAVADAIGVSVRELQRIAAGEQAEERETVQDKIDVSNGLLREIAGYTSETAAKDNSVEVIQPVF